MTTGQTERSGGNAPSGLLSFLTITKRTDFLRAARGRRVHKDGFVLQGWNRKDGDVPRMGYTCSKKVGNAIHRNSAKRRLREIARLSLPGFGQAGWDYVLIGRATVTGTMPLDVMQRDLEIALEQIHKPR